MGSGRRWGPLSTEQFRMSRTSGYVGSSRVRPRLRLISDGAAEARLAQVEAGIETSWKKRLWV